MEEAADVVAALDTACVVVVVRVVFLSCLVLASFRVPEASAMIHRVCRSSVAHVYRIPFDPYIL